MGNAQGIQQLDFMNTFERSVVERQISEAKEANAIARFHAQDTHRALKERFQSTIPPFVKWPIWFTRPCREAAPTTFAQLARRLGATTTIDGACVSRESVTAITYRLSDMPYTQLKVSFTNGELGTDDRRVLVALSHQASSGTRDAKSKLTICDEYSIYHDELAELVGEQPPRAWKRISLALWCLSGAYIQLLEGDPLVRMKGWSLNSFSLLPTVRITPQGRRYLITYTLHPDAHNMLQDDARTTFDMLRSLATRRRPAVESLYLLVFDVAQFTKGDYVEFSAASLHQRLGFCRYESHKAQQETDEWPSTNRTLKRIAEETESIAGFVTGFERTGTGPQAKYRFYLARGEARRIHTLNSSIAA